MGPSSSHLGGEAVLVPYPHLDIVYRSFEMILLIPMHYLLRDLYNVLWYKL